MSRVIKPGNRFMNTSHYDSSVYGPSKKVRTHFDGEDYHRAKTLSQWLFIKYDMTYKSFRNKSISRRKALRKEYESDTALNSAANQSKEEAQSSWLE